LLAGIVVGLIEFPAPGVEHLGFLVRSLYVRGVLYLLAAAPFFMTVPLTAGALCLFLTAVIYLIGAFRGEKWTHPREWCKPYRPPSATKLKNVVVASPSSPSSNIKASRLMSPNGDGAFALPQPAALAKSGSLSRPRLEPGRSNTAPRRLQHRQQFSPTASPLSSPTPTYPPLTVDASTAYGRPRLPSLGRHRQSRSLDQGFASRIPPATSNNNNMMNGQSSLYFGSSQAASDEDDFRTLYAPSHMPSALFGPNASRTLRGMDARIEEEEDDYDRALAQQDYSSPQYGLM
jgi:hypothetical protein